MKQTILDFKNQSVLCFGDLMLDQYYRGSTQRISREAPVPIVVHQDTYSTLGAAGNVANNVATYGAQVCLSGIVGDDANHQELLNLCEQSGVAPYFITNPLMKTIKKLRILSRNQQLVRIDFENQVVPQFDAAAMWAEHGAEFTRKLEQANVLILSDYNKGARCLFPYFIKIARERNIPVFVDPKGTDYSAYRGASFVKPNYDEFTEISLKYGFERQFIIEQEEQVAHKLIADLELEGLIITKADKGMTLYLANGKIYHQNTYAQEVFDVTGAGDTTIATLALAYHISHDIQTSCYLANKAAGIVVSKLGTSTVSIDELLEVCIPVSQLEQERRLTLPQLQELVRVARSRGETIVFTNGCFDILHRGHLTYLAQAKELGDRLIVGVNSDESVRRLKGPTRPVNNLEDRLFMLSSLKSIDWVIEFTEDTPLNLIKAIQPDIIVKGGDYAVIEEMIGYQEVTAYGGKAMLLPFVDNYSTTKFIDRIQDQGNKAE